MNHILHSCLCQPKPTNKVITGLACVLTLSAVALFIIGLTASQGNPFNGIIQLGVGNNSILLGTSIFLLILDLVWIQALCKKVNVNTKIPELDVVNPSGKRQEVTINTEVPDIILSGQALMQPSQNKEEVIKANVGNSGDSDLSSNVTPSIQPVLNDRIPVKIAVVNPLKKPCQNIKIPKTNLINIFLFLDAKNIARCSAVSSFFKQSTEEQSLWKMLCILHHKQAIVEVLESHVIAKTITWEEAFKFGHHCVSFLDQYLGDPVGVRQRMMKQNPHHHHGVHEIPTPFAQKGLFRFEIWDSYHIQVTKQGHKPFMLRGDDGILLSHVKTYENFVFALRYDGTIVQWNFLTREKIAVINTAYSNKDPQLKYLREDREGGERLQQSEPVIYSTGAFGIQDGTIFLHIGAPTGPIPSWNGITQGRIDIMQLNDLSKSMGCTHDNWQEGVGAIANNKLYVANAKGFFCIWDLQSQKILRLKMPIIQSLITLAVDRNFLCMSVRADHKSRIDVYDSAMGEIAFQLFPPHSVDVNHLCIHQNILFSFNRNVVTPREKVEYDYFKQRYELGITLGYSITAWDLNAPGSILANFDVVTCSDGNFIKEGTLERLLKIAKGAKPIIRH